MDKILGHNWTLSFLDCVINVLVVFTFFRLKMVPVKKYINKTDGADISEEAIVQALNDYRNGNYLSIRKAAEAHGLKKSTLHVRLKKI